MDYSSVGDYEVFLSFRGADTRQGFTDVLYECMSSAEIRVFRDDDELAVGDKIESIFGAINNSKLCIPIFSPKFAESKWCLSEIAKMVELKKTIVPVFYKVTSDDVKLKTSLYSNDLQKLEDKRGNHEVQKWKDALKEAVSNKGRTLGVQRYTEFCKELVDDVLSKLGPRKNLEIDYFVGDANKVEALRLLDMGISSSQEVVYVGIYGMGGIGKTTISKLIHNEYMSSFDHCAFLPDIREFSESNAGVKGLPKYLYDNIEPKSVAAFTHSRQIPNTFKNKKVLLILDDVDSCEQITAIAKEPGWFGSGSRIIVTTRDRDILRDYEEESEIEMRYLEMEELDSSWSLELLSKCAFKKDSPPSPYQDLSRRVVAYAGGLPLAVMVIGKLLRRYRTIGEWKEFIQRLEKNPPKEVKDRLLISYEKLEDNEKTIFLDIACLFIRKEYTETSNVFYMWKACDLYPRLSLEVLQARSLVKIDREDNTLQMHDQLRDLGRHIVRAQSGRDLTKQSRLWECSQVIEVLKCKKKTKENIEALLLPLSDTLSFDVNAEEFISFDNLKCLIISENFKLQGDFSEILPELIWLQCPWTIDPTTLVSSNLVTLNLPATELDENWDIWSQFQVLKKLKVLDISYCWKLERTPVFAENMVLERLIMRGCSRLAYIDPSIAKLQHLNYLTFSHCSSLDVLPESVGELHALQELDLQATNITHLPDSVGRLENLECLNLNLCMSLVSLPLSIGKLEKLQKLELQDSEVRQLPSTISHLSFLQSLDLYNCHRLQELPELPASLTELSVYSIVLNKVADLSNLQHLTYLRILNRDSRILGRDAAMLDWNGAFASHCRLQTLIVDVLNISRLPGLSCCSELTHLELKCKYSFKVLPNISGLMKLVSLKIESCQELEEIPGIQKLQSLTSLYISDCPSLESLENLRGLLALRELELIRCGKLTEIPGFGELQGLTKVKIEYCHSLERIDSLTALKKLKEVCLIDCPWLTEIPGHGGLLHLESLHIESCPSLLSLENVQELQLLNNFVLIGCQRLAEIPGLGALRGLSTVKIENCHSLEMIDNLTALKELKEFCLIECRMLTEIPGLGELLHLESLHIESCPSLLSLENVQGLQLLKNFVLVGCQRLTEIPGLDKLRCSSMLVKHEDGDSFVIFGIRKTESLNSNSVEETVKEEDVCRKQHTSVLVFDSDESVTPSDGSGSSPISELEGKVVALYFTPSPSFSSIEFTLDLFDVYEILKLPCLETAFEVVSLKRGDDRSFWQSFGSIPWLSLLPSSLERYKQLSAYFKVSVLSTEPTLVIVGEDGKVVNFNAVDMIKQHGARAYPFTLKRLEQLVNYNEKDRKELALEAMADVLCSKKVEHHLHIHELVPTLRPNYICNGCNQEGGLWAYCCEECDFDLCCQCPSWENISEQSSILKEEEEEDLQFLESPVRVAEGNSDDIQGQLLDLQNSQDNASSSKHVNLHAEQSFACSGSPHSRSCLDWPCCFPFLSLFRS